MTCFPQVFAVFSPSLSKSNHLNCFYEGHTLIPFLEKITAKFKLEKPIVVADAGLLSNDNIKALGEKNNEYIIGARLKNESEKIKQHILQKYQTRQQRSNRKL